MAELHPSAPNAEIERAWVDNALIESLLTQLHSACPMNVIGRTALLPKQLGALKTDLRTRTIRVIEPGEPLPKPSTETDIHYTSIAGISPAMLPRSRTLILNPFLAQSLLLEPDFFQTLGLKTFEWVLAPFFIEPEPFYTVYSGQFSFQEPIGDENPSRCWTEDPEPAVVEIVHGGEPGEYLVDFTLTGAQPGTFEISLGESTLSRKVSSDDPTYHFRLKCELAYGRNPLRISFDGGPWRSPNPSEQREQLYYCFANLRIRQSRAARWSHTFSLAGFTAQRDRSIRRILHNQGFFEIQTMGASTPALDYAVGLRSCFDYREGFRMRDYRRFPHAPSITNDSLLSKHPIVWYCLRKTPTPGSEWESYQPHLNKRPTLFVERPVQQTETPAGLADSEVGRLHQANTILRDDLIAIRAELADRTRRLERALAGPEAQRLRQENIILREDLITIRAALADRTRRLEQMLADSEVVRLRQANTLLRDDLVAIRAELANRTRRLELMLADSEVVRLRQANTLLRDELIAIREELVDRTRRLELTLADPEKERLRQENTSLREDLVAIRAELANRTHRLELSLADPEVERLRQENISLRDDLTAVKVDLRDCTKRLQAALAEVERSRLSWTIGRMGWKKHP